MHLPPINTTVCEVPSTLGSAESSQRSWARLGRSLGSLVKLSSLVKVDSELDMAEESCSGQQGVCLSPLSQFFCNVEAPPDIYAIMQLEGYCSVSELVRPMQHMAGLHDRFRRRLVYRFGTWKAEVMQAFDVTSLMREVTLDGPDAQQAFHDYMGQLMTSEPLGANGLPPWDVVCIHYTCTSSRTDVLMRASHIIGDGQLFMKLIKSIMDPHDSTAEADHAATFLDGDASKIGNSSNNSKAAAAGPKKAAAGGSSESSPCGSSSDDGSGSSVSEQRSLNGSNRSSRSDLAGEQAVQGSAAERSGTEQQQQQQKRRRRQHRSVKQKVGDFFKLIWRLITLAWHSYTAFLFTAILPFWFSDPVTVVKAAPNECRGPRRWSSTSLRLSEFHHTAKLLGHSINTLAVSCLAGGIRRYILQHGGVPGQRVRLCSMVDTRSMAGLLTGTHGNSNNFSFIGVPLFTGDCGPLQRIARVGWSLSWIRHSLAVPLAIRMPSILQFLFRDPAWSSWAILRCLPSKATVGFSNMRGPSGRWSLSGYPVVRIHNGVQPNAFGCFVSLFSYCDTVTFTHTCYSSKSSKPQVLLRCIVEEYEAVRKAAAVGAVGQELKSSEPGSPQIDKIKAA